MSFYMQKDGWPFIAGIIAGSGRKIDGMYVEYAAAPIDVGERSYDKYISGALGLSHVRVPVANAFISDGSKVNFTAYINTADMEVEPAHDMRVQCATMVSMGDSAQDDVFLFTVNLSRPIQLLGNAYIVVHTGMVIGDMR